jgi:hypothetical protein
VKNLREKSGIHKAKSGLAYMSLHGKVEKMSGIGWV